ncbi:ParA family protein [Peribacillus loiseleuriae]|uniref:ParA family protein n=1 Tax=Peribacillus loiseleuriae TaxID=1679170 RepID=UPI003D080420
MKVISVINYKGGVGKTTLSANIAAELAYQGKDVLVIDLDPQTNLTLSFIDVNEWQRLDSQGRTIKHWYDDFLDNDNDSSLRSLIITPQRINNQLNSYNAGGKVDLICSHLELINVDMELATRLGGNSDRTIRSNFLRVLSRLKQRIDDIKNDYDVILIDCPPNFNIVTQNAIIASDYYLVPAKPDYLSTLGIDQLLRHINELTNRYNRFVDEAARSEWVNITPTVLGVIFTMVTFYDQQPISAQREYIAQVRRTGTNTFTNYVRDNKTLFADAPEYGVPVVLKGDLGGTHLTVRTELEDVIAELIALAGF